MNKRLSRGHEVLKNLHGICTKPKKTKVYKRICRYNKRAQNMLPNKPFDRRVVGCASFRRLVRLLSCFII